MTSWKIQSALISIFEPERQTRKESIVDWENNGLYISIPHHRNHIFTVSDYAKAGYLHYLGVIEAPGFCD